MLKVELSIQTILLKFFIGFALIVVPVLVMMCWPTSGVCSSLFGTSVCVASGLYRASAAFLPYVMIIGGLLAGLEMKRIADSESRMNSEIMERQNQTIHKEEQ